MTKEEFLKKILYSEYPVEIKEEIIGNNYDPKNAYIPFLSNEEAQKAEKTIYLKTGIMSSEIIPGNHGEELHILVYTFNQ